MTKAGKLIDGKFYLRQVLSGFVISNEGFRSEKSCITAVVGV